MCYTREPGGEYLYKQVSHQMYEEGFQGVDLHDRTHIPEVDWMNSKPLPIQHQEADISFSKHANNQI